MAKRKAKAKIVISKPCSCYRTVILQDKEGELMSHTLPVYAHNRFVVGAHQRNRGAGMSKQEQLASLVKFAKLENTVINPCEFDPYSNPAHTWLVLEALVKYEQQVENKTGAMAWALVLNDLSRQSCKNHYEKIDFNFASAICSAALEVVRTNTKGE